MVLIISKGIVEGRILRDEGRAPSYSGVRAAIRAASIGYKPDPIKQRR